MIIAIRNIVQNTLLVVLLAVVAFSSTSNAAPSDQMSDEIGTGWEYKNLELTIAVAPAGGQIFVDGVATLTLARDTSAGPTLALNMALSENLRQEVLRYTSVTTPIQKTQVTYTLPSADQEADDAIAVSLAHIRADTPFEKGDEIKVAFSLESVGRGFQFSIGDNYAVASAEQGWYPAPLNNDGAIDQPAMRAPGRTKFILPQGWRSVTGGILKSTTKRNRKTVEVWETKDPLARSFVIGELEHQTHSVDGKLYGVYLVPEAMRPVENQGKIVPVREMLEHLSSTIAYFENIYGPFPSESFSVVEIPNSLVNWWGAQEEGFMIGTTGSLSAGRLRVFDTINHEAAHMWWGNQVQSIGPGEYLSTESMAIFSSLLAMESAFGADLTTHVAQFGLEGTPPIFNYSAQGYFQQWRDGKDLPLATLTSGSGNNYNLASAKGPWVYKMLRDRFADDDRFFGVFQDLLRRYNETPMRLADLRAAFIAAAPEGANIDGFFDQWLDQSGAPRLEASWRALGNDEIEITIRQTQTGDAFDLDLELDLYFNGTPTRQTLRLTETNTHLLMEDTGAIDAIIIDPRNRNLIWQPAYGPYPGQ